MPLKFSRVYHFVPARYALEDLRHRRLKITRLDELNDPFELWAFSQPDRRIRRAFKEMKDHIAQHYGIQCFCRSWHNPLLWSHYADRHRGAALGFDVDIRTLKAVSYVEQRPMLRQINYQAAQCLLYTKYRDWQYEQEVRIFTMLEDRDPASGLYFLDFGQQLVLREVIIGPLSSITKQNLLNILGTATGVTFTKGRLAFKSFQVVTDQRGLRAIR